MKYMTDKFCIAMYLKEELALLVHMPNKIVKFKQLLKGLYAMDPNDEKSFVITKQDYKFMNTLRKPEVYQYETTQFIKEISRTL